MVSVTALVVDWSTPQDLVRLIDSAQSHEPDMPWVVWRNYNAKFFDVPYRFQRGDRVNVIASNQNHGHGAGINRAAAWATYNHAPEYYFVVNPDCEFRTPIIDEMVDFLRGDTARWIVGPKQLDSKMRITAAGIFGTAKKPQHRLWHVPDPKNVLARDVAEAVMAAGSAFLISADHFHQLGGLLEAAHYYSDTWLAYHARAHGGQVWYYGQAWMIHEWHRSSPQGFDGTDGNFLKDRELFRQKCREHDPPIECE